MKKRSVLIICGVIIVFLAAVIAGVCIYNIPVTEKINREFTGFIVSESGKTVSCDTQINGEYKHWLFNNNDDNFQTVYDKPDHGIFINGENLYPNGEIFMPFMPEVSSYSNLGISSTDYNGSVILNCSVILDQAVDCLIIDGICYDFEKNILTEKGKGEPSLLIAPASDMAEAVEVINKLKNDESGVYDLWSDRFPTDVWKAF